MDDQTTPATKADINDLGRSVVQLDNVVVRNSALILELDTRIEGLDQKVGELNKTVSQLERRLTEVASSFDGKLMNFAEEVKRHFDVIAEDLRHDVMGANRDEVLSILDHQKEHSERIAHLEKLAGMPA